MRLFHHSQLLRLAARVLGLAGLLLALAASAAMADKPGAPGSDPGEPASGVKGQASAAAAGEVIPGEYIVEVDKTKKPKKFAEDEGVKPKFVYTAALNGFAAKLSDKQLQKLERHPSVTHIEAARRVEGDYVQTMPTGQPWGLDRMDQRYLGLSRSFTYFATGAGVRAYIIDSGIRTSHGEFGGRAQNVFDAFGGNGEDCYGHGTHVAGTVGGNTTGMAKRVLLRGVRVLDCQNNGSTPGIVAGMDWVRLNGIRPAVVNMSLGTRGGTDASIVRAANNLANAGFFVAAAAGNDGQPACNTSPANAAGALTVAASDWNDARAVQPNWSSNYGSCVDVYAPGVNVYSAYKDGGYRLMGGTSMATPHVAGLVAAAKSWYGDNYTAQAWRDWVKLTATANVIKGNITGTPNKLAFKGTGF